MLVLGLSAVRSTMAAWTDSEEATGSFSAGQIGQVQNLQCFDRDDGLLGGLLRQQVVLEWEPPAGFDEDLMDYEVTWNQSGLLGGQGTETTSDSKYTYTAASLGLVKLTARFTVKAKMKTGDWEGETQAASATSVGLLILSVYMKCN